MSTKTSIRSPKKSTQIYSREFNVCVRVSGRVCIKSSFFHPPAAVSLSISDSWGKGEKIISSSCVQSACLVPRLGAKRREKSWTVRPFYSPAAASTQSREGLGIKKERGRSREDLFTFSRQITTREREREGCALFFDIVMILFFFSRLASSSFKK